MVGCSDGNIDDSTNPFKNTSENVEGADSGDLDDEKPINIDEINFNLSDKSILKEEFFKSIYRDNLEMLSYVYDFVGKPAPNFKMLNMENEELSLEDFKGENVILEFMGTWCPACQSSAHIIEEFNNSNQNVRVVSVSIDEPVKIVKDFLEDAGLDEENYYVAKDRKAHELYEIRFVPILFYLDKEGYVQAVSGLGHEILMDFYDMLY